MNSADVEAIARTVVVEHGLPFSVLAVVPSAAGWDIRLREYTGGSVSLTIPNGRPIDIRVAIQERLEAQL